MPAKASIQKYFKNLDSRLHGYDVKRNFKTFENPSKLEPAVIVEGAYTRARHSRAYRYSCFDNIA